MFGDAGYVRGPASASAFLVAEDPVGVTQLTDNATRQVRLVHPRRGR